jgi:hypothetical protein
LWEDGQNWEDLWDMDGAVTARDDRTLTGASEGRRPAVAPVVPTQAARLRLRPVGLSNARIDAGFWADRLRTNRERTILHGASRLKACGNLTNFELAGGADGEYRSAEGDGGNPAPFVDTDVYKWLEAVAWELAPGGGSELRALAEPMIELVARAQRPDGYVDTFYQVAKQGGEFGDMEWGHELYVAGHLIQAAVAWKRSVGDERLLGVAQRFVARIESEIGPGHREAICGHPEFEMALVELYRETGERRHLEFARTLVDRRGHGLLGNCRYGARFWQDHEPVRSALEPAGHAVRQMYLDCGVVDVAVETGDRELLDSALHRWDAMVSSFTYLTGGLGVHHQDEAFGAPFELPPDRAYSETCAAIGGAMLSWRLLLTTGEERFADMIERQAYNAILPALALEGAHFFYSNPLMQRSTVPEILEGIATTRRISWPRIACCPPNVMRFLSSLPDLAVTVDEGGMQIHQYMPGTFTGEIGGGTVGIEARTRYPWDDTVEFTVKSSSDQPWTLSMRVPSWCSTAVASAAGQTVMSGGSDRIEIRRVWKPGDLVRLQLDMTPRITEPDPRIDAVRGCVALERGPLVYAVEDADLPSGASVESLEIEESPNVEIEARRTDDLGEMVWLTFDGVIRSTAGPSWPYGKFEPPSAPRAHPDRFRALPYFAWGNRPGLGMRIWIPKRP